MPSIRDVSQRNACFPEELGGAAPQGSTPYTVQKGDTLSKLAAGLQRQGLGGSIAEILKQILTLNPQIKDPNRIAQGATLLMPAVSHHAPTRQTDSRSNQLEQFVSRYPMTPAYQPARSAPPEPSHTFLRTNGAPFSTSVDGTPQYRQGDVEWGIRMMGDKASEPRSIHSKGCAMTSVAMALSKLSGKTITPGVLDAFLDSKAGYAGNSLKWGVAGQVTPEPISVTKTTTWNLDTINAELAAGRPVVLGVDYKSGGSGGSLGTDHWVCLTRMQKGDPDVYFANDPATGKEISLLRRKDGTLLLKATEAESQTKLYKSSGEFVTFRKAVQS
jgi:hypothetical protein